MVLSSTKKTLKLGRKDKEEVVIEMAQHQQGKNIERWFKKLLMTFLLLFNDLKYGKSSLFCCNGYRHAPFKILFL